MSEHQVGRVEFRDPTLSPIDDRPPDAYLWEIERKLCQQQFAAKDAQLVVLAGAVQALWDSYIMNEGTPSEFVVTKVVPGPGHPIASEWEAVRAALTPDLVTLAADYQDALAVRERVLAKAPKLWECDDCGFAYDARHFTEEQENPCPVCNETDLERQLADATRNAEFYDTLSSQLSAKVAEKDAQLAEMVKVEQGRVWAMGEEAREWQDRFDAKGAQLAVLAGFAHHTDLCFEKNDRAYPGVEWDCICGLQQALTPDLVALAADYRNAQGKRKPTGDYNEF